MSIKGFKSISICNFQINEKLRVIKFLI